MPRIKMLICTNFLSPDCASTWWILELLHASLHCLNRVIDILFQLLCLNFKERIIHPALIPLYPVWHCSPEIVVWLEFLKHLGQPTVLWKEIKNNISNKCIHLQMTAYTSKGQKSPPLFWIGSQEWENMYSKRIYQTTFSWASNMYSTGQQPGELGLTHSGQHISSGAVPAPCVWHGKHAHHLPLQRSPAEWGDFDGQATKSVWQSVKAHTTHHIKTWLLTGKEK